MTMFCSYNNFLLFICNINISVKCSDLMGFPGGSAVKNLLADAGGAADSDSVLAWVRNIPWRRKWQTTPVFLPGKFHG